ncbi:MAG: hypothetical protein R3B71_00920 [Candidatus Gracilibacteria bacterium]
MEVIRSADMRKYGQEIKDVIRQNPEMDAQSRRALEVQKDLVEVHQMVERRTGHIINTVMHGGPKNAAAFVETSNIQSGKKEHNVDVHTLYDAEHALHAGMHEAWHVKSRFTAIELEKELHPEHLELLQQTLGIQEVDQIFWLEGFNELATIQDIGKDANCAYNAAEVPAAQKLELLCMQWTGESLLGSYRSADKQTFYNRLRKLCDLLMADQIRRQLLQN